MPTASYVEDRINHYAQRIVEGGGKVDEHALGELLFLMALRRVTSGKASMQDVGMMDAINDFLQQRKLVAPDAVFYK